MSNRTHSSSGTFISTIPRLMAIGQLCIAFSLIFWYLAQPFMGEYFNLRSRMLLYEYVMGTSEILKVKKEEKKLEHNRDRFTQLPQNEQQRLTKDYQDLQTYAKRPIFQKLQNGIQSLIQDIPPFEQAWIFFTIIVAILLLLKKEEAKQAAWLLSLIVLAYCADNQLTGKSSSISPDLKLFPTEEELIQSYLDEPLSQSLHLQKEQMEKGWNQYLIENWSTTKNQSEQDQLEEAEFQFTLARLNLLHNQSRSEGLSHFHEKLHPMFLFFYLAWNGLFAWVVNRPST